MSIPRQNRSGLGGRHLRRCVLAADLSSTRQLMPLPSQVSANRQCGSEGNFVPQRRDDMGFDQVHKIPDDRCDRSGQRVVFVPRIRLPPRIRVQFDPPLPVQPVPDQDRFVSRFNVEVEAEGPAVRNFSFPVPFVLVERLKVADVHKPNREGERIGHLGQPVFSHPLPVLPVPDNGIQIFEHRAVPGQEPVIRVGLPDPRLDTGWLGKRF